MSDEWKENQAEAIARGEQLADEAMAVSERAPDPPPEEYIPEWVKKYGPKPQDDL
jgi:hypothetical protein